MRHWQVFGGLLLTLTLLASTTAAPVTVPVVAEVTPGPRIVAPTIIQFAGVEGEPGWVTEPPEARLRFVEVKIPVGTTLDGETLYGAAWRLVWDKHPEVVVLLLGDREVLDRYVIPADGGPAPPDPPVPPIVDPPEPPIPTEIVVVFESKRRTPEQAAVMLDRKWEKYLVAKGIAVQRLDRDQLPQRLRHLKADSGPVVYFLDGSGEGESVPLPDSIEGLSTLVKEKTSGS